MQEETVREGGALSLSLSLTPLPTLRPLRGRPASVWDPGQGRWWSGTCPREGRALGRPSFVPLDFITKQTVLKTWTRGH